MLKHINMKFYMLLFFLISQCLKALQLVLYAKFQWQNLLSVVAHHAISVCSSAFVFAKQKLGSETGVQERKRTKEEGSRRIEDYLYLENRDGKRQERAQNRERTEYREAGRRLSRGIIDMEREEGSGLEKGKE